MTGSPSHLEERLLEVVALLREHDPTLLEAIEPAIERVRESDLPPIDVPLDSPLTPPEIAGRPLATFVMGCGRGTITRALRDGLQLLEKPPPVTVVETDPTRMLATMLHDDWSDLIADEFIRFAVGLPLMKRIEAVLPEARDPMLEFDHGIGVVFGESSDHAETVRATFEEVANRANARFSKEAHAQTERTGDVPKLPEGAWKIASATSLATTALKNLATSITKAACEHGHDARALLTDHLRDPFLASNHMRWMLEVEPDVCVSFLRPGAMLAPWRKDYPSLVLVSSDPRMLDVETFPWSEREFVVVTDPGFASTYEALGAKTAVRPLATDLPEKTALNGGTPCDVIVVGNLPGARTIKPDLNDADLEHLCARAEEWAANPSDVPDEYLGQTSLALAYEATARRRAQAAIALAEAGFSVRIHGGEEWKPLIASTAAESCWHGPLDPITEQPAAFNAAAVSINVNSFATPGMLNMRSFDVPAAGGVLLCDEREALHTSFDVGSEVLAFQQTEELPDLVADLLRNPDRRKAISEAGHLRTERDHTWEAWWKWAEAEMRSRFGT